MWCFSRPSSKDVTNLGTLPQSRECRDAKKLYRNNGHIIIHHRTSINQLEKLFHTHFWVILVTFNDVPPIQATYRVFEPLTRGMALRPDTTSQGGGRRRKASHVTGFPVGAVVKHRTGGSSLACFPAIAHDAAYQMAQRDTRGDAYAVVAVQSLAEQRLTSNHREDHDVTV